MAGAAGVTGATSPPQPPRSDDALGRTLARAVVARAQATEGEVGGLDELVEELSVAIWARENGTVHVRLRLEAFRLDQIMERFRARKGQGLRQTIVAANRQGVHRDKGFVRALAVLHGGPDAEYEPWAQMGLALIPLGTRDIDLTRLLEERPLAQRRRLKSDYDKAFASIGKTAGDTLEEHIVSDTSGWQREKALALLDHELTPADHLALVTVAITGAHDETALEILREVWRQGPAAFDALYEDWQRFVKGPGFTTYPLEQAMAKELGGVHLEAAQAIFAEYHAMRAKVGLRPFASMDGHEGSAERADARLQETTIEIGLQSGVFTSNGALVVQAARDLRKAWEKRIKRDRREASEWIMRRERLSLLFAGSLGLRGADMVEARIQLERDPTPVDRIYLASARREYAKALDAATDAWQAGTEHELDRALRNPPAGDPRPALAVNERAIPLSEDVAGAYEALTSAKLSHAERGAVRLQTDATGFEQSPTMIDLLHLLLPGNELSDALAYAERRDRATHTGNLDFAATGMVSIYDSLTAEDTQEVADDALSRLRRWVRGSRASPQELEAVMEAEGVTEVTALAKLGYERFAVRLDEVRSVKASVVEGVGMFVDFAGRSLLVAVLGAAGLPGLLAALGAYTAGMVVREELLGVEYQAQSVQNLSTLIAEVATFGFDELLIENVIKELLPAGAAKGAIFGAQGLSDTQAKFAQEYLKGTGAKLFEKAAQNMVEGSSFPTADQLLARAGHAFAAAGLKAASARILTSPTVVTPTAERLRENLKKVILNGPPPKAAIGYAMAKELTDMLASPDWGNTTLQEKLARVTKAGLVSVASAVPVAVAFTSLGAREATRAKKLAQSHPDVFYARLRSDPVLSAAYDSYKQGDKDLKPAASAIKDMDETMTPHATKRWSR